MKMDFSLQEWMLIAIVGFGVWVVLTLFLWLFNPSRDRVYHRYVKDEKVRDVKKVSSKSRVFFTSGQTFQFIRKYVINRLHGDKYLVCNYAKKFKRISYYVLQYNSFRRLINVSHVVELDNEPTSRVIDLKRGCKTVNIVVNKVDDLVVNSDIVRYKTSASIFFTALLRMIKTVALLVGLDFVVSFFVVGGNYIGYLNSMTNLIVLGACLAIGLINAIFSGLTLRFKNRKKYLGGVIEYEFL